jgi:uncharacterized coiled-coil protein SlyX
MEETKKPQQQAAKLSDLQNEIIASQRLSIDVLQQNVDLLREKIAHLETMLKMVNVKIDAHDDSGVILATNGSPT